MKPINEKIDWIHKDEWKVLRKDFCVVISRHTDPSTFDEGPNRWAVYAYIYPSHPLFKDFDGDDMFQSAAIKLPLHCGVSFLKWHYNQDQRPTSIQVGADYHHLYDNPYTHYSSKDDAYNVFCDAETLISYLTGV